MGFMGLSHWVESDGASDFRFVLQEAKGNKAKLKKLIATELKDFANEYNTPGFLNVALVIADEGVKNGDGEESDITPAISNLLTKTQKQFIIKHLKECRGSYSSMNGSGESRLTREVDKLLVVMSKINH
jgi:hypothetical protein